MSDVNDHPLDQLSWYLDDGLAVEERARIDRHLALCPACREHLAALRRLSHAIAAESIPSPPEGLEGKVLRRLDEATVVPFRRRFMVPASVAATIAAAGLLAVVAWKQGGPPVVPVPAAAPSRPSEPVRRERAEQGTESDASGKVTAPPPAQAPPPPRTIPTVTPEALKETHQEPEPKAKRDDRPLDKLAAQPAPSPVGSVGGISAKDERAPAAATSGAAFKRMAGAPPAEARADTAANGPASTCALGTVDSQLEAVWEVTDLATAGRTLATLASMEAGRVESTETGGADGVTVVVPAERFAAFANAARAIGVGGLAGATPPAAGGCVRQRIRLVPTGLR